MQRKLSRQHRENPDRAEVALLGENELSSTLRDIATAPASGACSHEAIALSDDGAAVDPNKCQNSALCFRVCTTGALPIEEVFSAIFG